MEPADWQARLQAAREVSSAALRAPDLEYVTAIARDRTESSRSAPFETNAQLQQRLGLIHRTFAELAAAKADAAWVASEVPVLPSSSSPFDPAEHAGRSFIANHAERMHRRHVAEGIDARLKEHIAALQSALHYRVYRQAVLQRYVDLKAGVQAKHQMVATLAGELDVARRALHIATTAATSDDAT
jgi:hypothetical protein